MSKRSRAEQLLKQEDLNNKNFSKQVFLMKCSKKEYKKKKSDVVESDFMKISFFEEIRDRKLWKKKSYNKEVQKREFLKYLYFKYEAPNWAIEYLINVYDKINKTFSEYIDDIIKNLVNNSALGVKTLDLINVAMKGKGYKELFQNILTNRELHYFINSEEENIEKAFLDAKLRSFDIEKNKLIFLKTRFENLNLNYNFNFKFSNPKLELLYFLAKNSKQLDINAMQEIYDYFLTLIPFRFRNDCVRFEDKEIHVKDFFKKSLSTIIQLSNKYHIDVINLKNRKFVEWTKTYEDIILDDKYLFKELTNNTDLSREGNRMRHCVGSYAERCLRGYTKIISLRDIEVNQNLLTIEISNEKIVQVKGRLNREPYKNEKNIIQKFADKNSIKYNY